MFVVQVNIVTQADQAAHRVELTSELVHDAMQLWLLSVVRCRHRRPQTSRSLARLFTDRAQGAARMLVHGDDKAAGIFQSGALLPLDSSSAAFCIITEDACGVIAPALATRSFAADATCASVQGGAATRGLSVMVNRYLTEANRYIMLQNASSAVAEAQLASVSQQIVPLIVFAAKGFKQALDAQTAREFQQAHNIDAALSVVCIGVGFRHCCVLHSQDEVDGDGCAVHLGTRALLVLLAPTLLAADSGSTMTGVLRSLASEVAAEQTVVGSMPAASLGGGSRVVEPR